MAVRLRRAQAAAPGQKSCRPDYYAKSRRGRDCREVTKLLPPSRRGQVTVCHEGRPRPPTTLSYCICAACAAIARYAPLAAPTGVHSAHKVGKGEGRRIFVAD